MHWRSNHYFCVWFSLKLINTIINITVSAFGPSIVNISVSFPLAPCVRTIWANCSSLFSSFALLFVLFYPAHGQRPQFSHVTKLRLPTILFLERIWLLIHFISGYNKVRIRNYLGFCPNILKVVRLQLNNPAKTKEQSNEELILIYQIPIFSVLLKRCIVLDSYKKM